MVAMYKLFTQTQATELIGVVDPLLRDLQTALKDVVGLRDAYKTRSSDSLQAQQLAAEIKFVLESAQLTKLQLDSLGVLVQDVEQGLVDFPSKLGAEVIYLCWEQGQDAVTHYHGLSEAVAARQPLPNGLPAQDNPDTHLNA